MKAVFKSLNCSLLLINSEVKYQMLFIKVLQITFIFFILFTTLNLSSVGHPDQHATCCLTCQIHRDFPLEFDEDDSLGSWTSKRHIRELRTHRLVAKIFHSFSFVFWCWFYIFLKMFFNICSYFYVFGQRTQVYNCFYCSGEVL